MSEEVIAGRYRLVTLLGRSGMSEVWSADDRELERRVALKLLAPDADRARFDREARAAAALAHPNITQLYDYGEADDRPYMVLEYLPGGTLESLLEDGKPLPDADATRIASELAAGLAHAHDRGLVHRDLKPANVLFDGEGRAKIADFGIARLGQGGTLTEAGTVLGTAAYISPEQAAGEPAGPASDVYSFGVMLFRMLTGRLPFEAAHPMELVKLHRDAEPPPLASFRSDPPPELAALAEASLQKDPEARPANGRALATALGAPTTLPPGAAPAPPVVAPAGDATQVLGPPGRPPRSSARRRLAGALALLALLVAGAAAAFALTRSAGTGGQAGVTTGTVGLPTRSLPNLTAASTSIAAVVQPPATSTAATTTRAARTTRPATTSAPPPATTVAPSPPATTVEPPPATTVPPATTAPPPTDTTTVP